MSPRRIPSSASATLYLHFSSTRIFNLEIFVIIFSGKSFCAQLHWLKTACAFISLLMHWFCLNKNLFLLLFYHWPTVNFLPKIIFNPQLELFLARKNPQQGRKGNRRVLNMLADTGWSQTTSPWGWAQLSAAESFRVQPSKQMFSQASTRSGF